MGAQLKALAQGDPSVVSEDLGHHCLLPAQHSDQLWAAQGTAPQTPSEGPGSGATCCGHSAVY